MMNMVSYPFMVEALNKNILIGWGILSNMILFNGVSTRVIIKSWQLIAIIILEYFNTKVIKNHYKKVRTRKRAELGQVWCFWLRRGYVLLASFPKEKPV